MRACLTENAFSLRDGMTSGCSSTYPVSERAYFKRVYGSDHLHQLHDGHQEAAISRYILPWKRAEMVRIQNRLSHLTCENDPEMTAPGRSAYSLKQLSENLDLYCSKQCRSLRWNRNYQAAKASVASDVRRLLPVGRYLQPMEIGAVAASEQVQRNLDKNAGYMGFETGLRSKGENLALAVEWCLDHMREIAEVGNYGLPLVISHRSSNSKPTSRTTWKWRCRIILMQDVRAILLDGRFAVPATVLFMGIPWGEGGMNQKDVRHWIDVTRRHYDRFYSSDYSKFDTSQAAWLLEDVFNDVYRPLFGPLSEFDEALFNAMRDSYINKEIHGFDGVRKVRGCQVSGSLTTYMINTIVNEIVDRTALLMQGCDINHFKSLKCGDDNLTYYESSEPWSATKHCELIERYFGIKTKLGEEDQGDSSQNPTFLSRVWTPNGEKRNIDEVIFNLIFPERFRDYDSSKTGISERRAEALVLLSSCLEQELTMRQWFDVDAIYQDAEVKRGDVKSTYHALAAMGSGFQTPWIRWKFGLLSDTA